MARAQSQFLRLFDDGSTYQRWQSYYANATVTYDGSAWQFIPFSADGFTAGSSGEEASISITAPATSVVISAFQAAIRLGRLAELSIYQFDTTAGNNSPQAGQILVSRFTGQVVGGTATLTTLTLQLGSALAPIGVQIPPRKFTTAIMGKGCVL